MPKTIFPCAVRSSWKALLTFSLLSGCAHYTPLPLATTSPLSSAETALPDTPPGAQLSVDQVVRLALTNNPALRATRAKRGLADAQLLQSGILPNPSLTGAFLPLISGVGTVPAWNVGLTQNIKALVTYRASQRAARYAARQVYADVLWQEWQIAGQARQLATDLIAGERSRPLLVEAFQLLDHRRQVVQQAVAAGNATLVTATPTIVAVQAARTSLYQLDQAQLSRRHQLNALLGLVPEAEIRLAPTADLPPFDPTEIRANLATLVDRRPDLLALRLGYAPEDAKLRVAILSQFPDLVLGGQSSSDNAKVINAGPTATVGLPIFDRNQGNIAIERATRLQLHEDYSARLAAATGQVGAMLREMAQLQAQLDVVRRDLPAARLAAQHAANAFGSSLLDERSFVELVTNRYTKEQEVMTLELALLDRQVALQTLLGAGLPSVDTLPTIPNSAAAAK